MTRSLSLVNESVNQVRRLRRRLNALVETVDGPQADIANRANAVATSLRAIEGVLVDVHQESAEDVLRHPVGLNGILADLISYVAASDTCPTAQAFRVSREVMAKVETEAEKLKVLVAGEVAGIIALAMERNTPHTTTTQCSSKEGR
ncbi:hypothetical protein O7A70_32685 [Mesorhizobium sp. Cs1299R1N1]|uniref:hypothetical protein n=1 Tax=Mesorhizobium sp. Cs1299R1N1 TaxID=3015172 RepID=UPI00301C499D